MPKKPAAKYVLKGRVVTMDAQFSVIKRGALYVADNRIVKAQDESAPPPPGFEAAPEFWSFFQSHPLP